MKVYMRSQQWIILIITVAVFSTINVYFLSPEHYYSQDDKKAIHRFEHQAGMTNEPRDKVDVRGLTTVPGSKTEGPRVMRSETTCPNVNISVPVDDLQTFQPIAGTGTYVYTAYLVNDRVRVIVLRNKSDPRSFFCHLWTNGDGGPKLRDNLYITKGYVYTIPEDHNREYMASYIVCDLPSQLIRNPPPFAVSVVFKDKCSPSSNRLPLSLPKSHQQFNFTVCVTPLNRNFSQSHMFVEMIEFNRLLGADRFVFYNHSIHPQIGKLLHHYRDLGLVEILQWPSALPRQAHYFGQLAALNDCLYRYKSQSRYIVFQDLDEFIIPTRSDHLNWSDLVKSRLKLNPKFVAFQARCTFFRKEWPKLDGKFLRNDEVKRYHSVVLGHTLREDNILHNGHRSKYIVNPAFVETAGIHEVWASSGPTDRLNPNTALLYHYRDWENPNDTQKRLEDTYVVEKYGRSLVDRLAEAWHLIQSHTGLLV